MQIPSSLPPAGLGAGSLAALFGAAPTWVVICLAVLAVISGAVPYFTTWATARAHDRVRSQEREKYFTVMDSATSALGPQERVTALTEVLRILFPPEPAPPEPPPPPVTGGQASP